MQQTMEHYDSSFDLPEIKQLSLNAPIKWLGAGLRDFRRTFLSSSFYGLVFVLLGYAVTAASWQYPILVLTFVTGFLLVAPFLALGLYDLSHQGESSKKVSFIHSLLSFRQNKLDMGLLVIFHTVVMIAWIRLASLISAFYFFSSSSSESVYVFLEQLWLTREGLEMFALLTLSGAVLAAVVFVASAISWPMILDRKNGAINAMATSIKAVMHNKLVMLIWASIIGVLFVIGLATLYIGLLFIVPILGHASWHAYKELVK